LAEHPEVPILYVMAEQQINAKALRFIDEAGLRDRVHFLADPESAGIRDLGLLLEDGEPMEAGVAHPSTYVLDAEGRVVLSDVRRDYHIWLDPGLLVATLEGLEP
jgi:peroxiredoxin